MPVNSFQQYPMSWQPKKEKIVSPYYISLAELLIIDIEAGVLKPNTKLPPQRELADFLDLNLSTIVKAFKLCEERGLIRGIRGKGTFVAPNSLLPKKLVTSETLPIELGMVVESRQHSLKLEKQLGEIPLELSFYKEQSRIEKSLSAGTKWFRQLGIQVKADQLKLAKGVQNALAIVLLSLFKRNDRVAVDRFTYTNFIQLASLLGISLIPIEGDSEGMVPEKLEQVCQTMKIKGIYLMPSSNSPDVTIFSEARRLALSKVMKQFQLIVIEDETYTFLQKQPLVPFQALLPKQTIYLTGLSKIISAKLKLAYMIVPASFSAALDEGLYALNFQSELLAAEIGVKLIETGDATAFLMNRREAAEKRNQIYYKYFPSKAQRLDSYFQWLQLPTGLASQDAEVLLRERGVSVFASDRFAVGCNLTQAIRIAIISPETTKELHDGLKIIHDTIENWKKE